jgi:hypothetical protein
MSFYFYLLKLSFMNLKWLERRFKRIFMALHIKFDKFNIGMFNDVYSDYAFFECKNALYYELKEKRL